MENKLGNLEFHLNIQYLYNLNTEIIILDLATSILLKFRQKAINEMVTGINVEYNYKSRNTHTVEGN